MNSPKPTPVSTPKSTVFNIGPCRFKRLKLYARTITKNGKTRCNATAATPSEEAKRTLEMIKETLEFIDNPESRVELPQIEEELGGNFATIRGPSSQAHTLLPMHSLLLTLSNSITEFNSPVKELQATREIQRLPMGHMTECPRVIESPKVSPPNLAEKEQHPRRPSVESTYSLLPLSETLSETTCLPPREPISTPLSPSFLNPRQAPSPPPTPVGEPHISIGSSVDVPPEDEAHSCHATLAESDSFQSAKYNTPTMDRSGDRSSLISEFTTTLPSIGSGLELIGAALLRYNCLSNERCLLTSSCSSLDAQGAEDRSLGSLLDTMECYGSFVYELSQTHSNNSVTTFVLPSTNSPPASLVDSSSSLNDLLRRNSQSSTAASPRVKSLPRASFVEKLSYLEQILQDQGVILPSSRNLMGLWNALSTGATRESFTASRARDILQSIAACEPQGTMGSKEPSCPSDLLDKALLERIENVLKSRSQGRAPVMPDESVGGDILELRNQGSSFCQEEGVNVGIAI